MKLKPIAATPEKKKSFFKYLCNLRIAIGDLETQEAVLLPTKESAK